MSSDGGRARAGDHARRSWRTALAAAGLAVAVGLVVSLRIADGDGGSARRIGVAVSVTVNAQTPGKPVPADFLGLSFEVSSAAQIARYGESGNFVGLLRSLGPGLLRLGGASADTRTAWVDALSPRPAWASGVLEAGDFRRLRALAARSGWHVLLTLNLAHFDAQAAAREVVAAKAALGPWLAAIEVGNEPDSYAHHRLRSEPWTPVQFDGEVRRYRAAIAQRTPGLALVGPDVSGSLAFERWGAVEARSQHPALLTGHHYPLRCDGVPAPTITQLLSPRTRRLEGVSLRRFLAVSRATGIPFRIDEANSVSCGGRPGISDTFASALWGVGYIAQSMAAGAAGINLEGAPANCVGYSPVCAATPQALAAGALHPQPVWYSLLLTSALEGARPLRSRRISAGAANLVVQAFATAGGGMRLAIVDYEPPSAGAARLSVRVGPGFQSASVLALSAPSPSARSGVELGGRAVASDGSWRAPGALPRVAVHGGVLSLSVPASSAALVTLVPGGAGAPGGATGPGGTAAP